jgi:hypothetical protein
VVQGAYASNKSAETKQRLNRLTQAAIGMFTAMQTAFNKLDYRESETSLAALSVAIRCNIHAQSRYPSGNIFCRAGPMVRAMVRVLLAIHEIHRGAHRHDLLEDKAAGASRQSNLLSNVAGNP